jgi:two-component system sensor histidine kinase PilS (NtrC family)
MPSAFEIRTADDGLRRRLVWLTLLRIVLVTILLVSASLIFLRSPNPTGFGRVEQILYGTILATYAASLAYLMLLRSGALLRRLAFAQIAGDVLIAGCLVYMTGGSGSIVVFMFPLAVVSAAVLLYRQGAIVAAVGSTAALTLVVLGLNEGWLPAPNPAAAQARMDGARLAYFLLANTSALFLTAALASYLAEQLRATRERLTLREHDYVALEHHQESILRSIASGILTADRFGRLTFVNRAAEAICELELAEVDGDPIVRHLPQLAGHLDELREPVRFEDEHTLQSGERRWLQFSVAPLFDREGANRGHVVALEDLTSIRAREEAMRRAEQLAAVGAMAAGLAHELRNPLASMSGSIQLLGESKVFSEDEQKLMQIVLREADRLNGLVTDFLQFAHPAPPQLEPVRLRDVVASTLTLFGNDPARRHVEVRTELDGELMLMGDARQLGQLLWNLLANAADALPRGGRVRVSARSAAQGAVEIVVADSGPGIEREALAHVFEPFFTTKDQGTGLGLAIVHGIVEGHGGEIAVRNAEDQGAIFTIRLPAAGGGAVRAVSNG